MSQVHEKTRRRHRRVSPARVPAPASEASRDASIARHVVFAINSSDEDEPHPAIELTGTEEEVLFQHPRHPPKKSVLFDAYQLLEDLQSPLDSSDEESEFHSTEQEHHNQEEARFIDTDRTGSAYEDYYATSEQQQVSCLPSFGLSDRVGRLVSSAKLRVRGATRTRRQRQTRAREQGRYSSTRLTTKLDVLSKEKSP